MRAAERLSARAVQNAKTPGMLPDGKGLYLRVSRSGTKSWIFRYRGADGRHDLGLGAYPDFSLTEARERATAQRKLRADGTDPITLRRAQRAAPAATFKECAERYIAAHSAGWRGGKTEAHWRQTFVDYAFPVIGDLPVQRVDVGLVLKVVEPIWTMKPETANRVRGRIEAVLDWATAREYRTGDNPARWKGRLENLLPAVKKIAKGSHHAALPYPEVGAFMVDLRQQDKVAARALEFAILTAARTGEVLGVRWDEIVERLWIVPGERMKAGKEHRVPLSEAAMAIVESMPRRSEYVFPSKVGKPLHDTMLVKMAGKLRPGITTHGFRSSFRDWAAETGIRQELAEAALAHNDKSATERAYNRTALVEQRRSVMEAWAAYLAGRQDDKVVAIRA